MTIAIYPGTFDPIHYGHIDIAERAAQLFDKVIVGVYDRPQKNLTFPAETRLALAREALKNTPNIEVYLYTGLTVDFARKHGARVIVRGMRFISDFELEYQMALTTRKLAAEVDLVCLMTSLEYAFISSSSVKEIAFAGGSVSAFVPPHVEQALKEAAGQQGLTF